MQAFHLRIDSFKRVILQIVFRVIRPEGEVGSFQEQQSGTMKRKFAGDRAGKDSAIIADSNIMKKWSRKASSYNGNVDFCGFTGLSRVIHDRRIEVCTGKIWNDCSWIWILFCSIIFQRGKNSLWWKKMKI